MPELVERTLHAQSWFFHAVQINLRGLDTLMAHQFLHGADVGAALQQMCAETVPEDMGRDPLVQVCFFGGTPDGVLKSAVDHVMPSPQF